MESTITQKMNILDQIKGCKVQDDDGSIYTVVDVKFFNGILDLIGLETNDDRVVYCPINRYMEMASIA